MKDVGTYFCICTLETGGRKQIKWLYFVLPLVVLGSFIKNGLEQQCLAGKGTLGKEDAAEGNCVEDDTGSRGGHKAS